MGELITAAGDPLEYAIAAWLHAKITRTNSAKTHEAYAATITRFRAALGHLGLDLDSDPARIADVAQVWAGSSWDTAQRPLSANTHNQRLAILSSFYTFARKRRMLNMDNPIGLLDRQPAQAYAGAHPMDTQAVADCLAMIDRGTLLGMRDYALLAIAFYTGRRRAELMDMQWGHINWERDRATITFPHAKGGKYLRDTLTASISLSLREYVLAVHGEAPDPSVRLWISLSHHAFGHPLSHQAIADIYRKHLGTSKVHTSRHTFAHAMNQVGAKVTDIQARLGHANLQTTSIYLAAMGSATNEHGHALAELLGLDQ